MRNPDYSSYAHSDARREERGKDRVQLRPPAPTSSTLDAVARKLMTTRSLAAAYAIDRAAKELEGMTPEEIREAIRLVRELEGL